MRDREKDRAKGRRYYAAHRAERCAHQRQYAKEHPGRSSTPEAKEYHRKWLAEHRDKVRAYHAKSYAKCKPKRLQEHKEWVKANPEKVASYYSAYRKRHPEQVKMWRRKWFATHPQETKEFARKARAKAMADPEKAARLREQHRLAAMQRRHANPQPSRDWTRLVGAKRRFAKNGGSVSRSEWRAIVAAWNGLCAYCGVAPGTTMDHLVALKRGGKHVADNVVPACRSCNSRKQALLPLNFLWRLAV